MSSSQRAQILGLPHATSSAGTMEIREVHEDMIDAVKNFLADRKGFRDLNGWKGLFHYDWKLPAYPYGYVITEGEEILAFVGTIFSQRLIDGRVRICCNMNTWYVLEKYRSRMLAIRILKPILSMNGILITALSPGDLTVAVLERLGFKLLDEEQIAIPVTPAILPAIARSKRPLVLFDEPGIQEYLSEEDRKIFQDHSTLACKHFLIKEKQSGRYCYGIATTSPLRKLSFLRGQWLNLCYLSNPDVFVEHFRFFRWHLLRRRFLALCYDARLIPKKFSRISLRKKKKRQYRWKEDVLGKVDNLYSELVTFNKY
jgi:acetoacetyl-CoA synthetase